MSKSVRIGDLPLGDLAIMRLLHGPMPSPDFLSDGCTHCPDESPMGVQIRLACYKHDWAYSVECLEVPATAQGRMVADGFLWLNVQVLGLEEHEADVIWEAVRDLGESHFKVDG